jgi:hypothetical protein
VEIGELVGKFEAHAMDQEECKEEDEKPKSWKAHINKWGTSGKKCTATQLYKSMTGLKANKTGYLAGPIPWTKKFPGRAWEMSHIDTESFPLQAHHIIPKNHLPSHSVCSFLAKKCKMNEHVELVGDTPYDTDHAHNGYCMPYATPLKEWKKAKNDNDKHAVAFLVMTKSRRQLHQGSHRAGDYVDPPNAHEEPLIHTVPGYLDTIDELLNAIETAAFIHAVGCPICHKEKKGKMQILPREAVVVHMDQVSGIVKTLVDANRIFISKLAHSLWSKKPKKVTKPAWLNG